MTSASELQSALNSVAEKGLACVRNEDVVAVAVALWHAGLVPALLNLKGAYVRDAGYLVDRLSRVNIVDKDQKLALSAATVALRGKLGCEVNHKVTGRLRDPLAEQWGAGDDYSRFRDVLLPLQTRHHQDVVRTKLARKPHQRR